MKKNELGLYPCPYCGSVNVDIEDTVLPLYDDDNRTVQSLQKMYYICCHKVICNHPYKTLHTTEKAAIEAWNFECEQKVKERQNG